MRTQPTWSILLKGLWIFPFILAGCGGDDEASHGSDAGHDASLDAAAADADADSDADADGDADSGPDSGCGNGVLGPYDETVTIDYYGRERTYRVIVPSTYDPDVPTPLLTSFHDYAETADDHVAKGGLKALAEAEGVVVLAILGGPDPDAGLPSWNVGDMMHANKEDDLLLARDLAFDLSKRWCIDMNRLYLSGFGLGGYFASRAMFWMSDLYAALQEESGGVITGCRPPVEMRPVLIVHGEDDSVYPVSEAMVARDYWLQHHRLSDIHAIDENGCEVYTTLLPDAGGISGEDVEVRVCIVPGLRHERATGPGPGDAGAPFDSTIMGWDFLKRFRR